MHPIHRLAALVLVATSVIGLHSPAFAGGLFLYEFGTRDVGLAAAGWSSRADDAATLFRNPAGMSRLEGSSVLLGAQAIYGDLGFVPNSNTTTSGGDGGNPIGFLPGGSAFYVRTLPSGWSFGAGALSYFGLAAEYEDGWVGRYYVEKSTMLGLTLMPAVSYKASEVFSIGAGLNAMYGVLEDRVAVPNFASGGDGDLTIEDKTWGFGANVGAHIETASGTRIGATYLSQVNLDFQDVPEFNDLGPLALSAMDRKGLGGAELGLGLNVPMALMLSLSQPLSEGWKLHANGGWQNWKEFGKVHVSVADTLLDATTTSTLKDTWHGALGFEWKYSETWVFRTGFAYDSSPVEDEDRVLALPLGATYRIGLGAQTHASESVDVGLAYDLTYMGDLPVDQMRGPIAGRVAGDFADSMLHAFAIHVEW